MPALLLLLPAGLPAQDPHILPDARLPRAGEVWIELFPALLNWSDQYAPGGDREPLEADFEGSILSRLFPAFDEELLTDLNEGAEALGYDPLGLGDLSLGALDFGTLNVQAWRALASVRIGILDRVAIELGAPIAFTDVEPLFAWDTTAASLARAAAALPNGGSFLSGMEDARATLQQRVDEGTLSPEQQAAAVSLLDDSGLFLAALGARIEEDRFLPLAGSGAGSQMLGRFGALSDGFAAFEIELPSLDLQESPGVADLEALFTGEPLFGRLPGKRKSSVDIGEVEAGVVVGLLDTTGDRERRLRLRTAVGAKIRIPIKDADAPPFRDRTDPFRLSIGDGQRDVELSAHQDLWLGSRLRLAAAGRVGIQAADELRVRVHPPDRPFARPEAEATVRRDLGDYVQLRLAPQLTLAEIMSVGLEYGYWRKGADAYRLLEDVPEIVDAGPLELETREVRHRLGIGVFYRPGERERRRGAQRPDAGVPDAERSDVERPGGVPEDGPLPWRLGLVFQWAVAGSGGRTPASQLLAATFRIPFRPF